MNLVAAAGLEPSLREAVSHDMGLFLSRILLIPNPAKHHGPTVFAALKMGMSQNIASVLPQAAQIPAGMQRWMLLAQLTLQHLPSSLGLLAGHPRVGDQTPHAVPGITAE